MREFRTSGSVGAPGGQPPGATRQRLAGVWQAEELVEMLLARTERATDAEEKAQTMAETGRWYVSGLDDRDVRLDSKQ